MSNPYSEFPYSDVDRIIESLSQINVNLEGLRISLLALSETAADHEERLRQIERWKHNLTPILATLTFLLGVIFSVAMERIL